MIKKNLQVNCLGTLMTLLIVSFLAGGIVYAEEQLTAEELLAQCRDKYALARKYWVMRNYSEAKALYQDISENCPDSDLLLRAKADIAYCELNLGNYDAAEQAIETLKSNYSQHENLCAELYILSDEYWCMEKFDEAKKLLQFITQNSSDSNLAMKSRIWIAGCEIRLDNDITAEQAIDAFKNDYSQHPEFYTIIFELAKTYRRDQKFDKAKALDRYILQNSSDSNLALEVQAEIVNCEILLGNDSAAEEAFEKLINDYSRNPDLSKVAMAILACVVEIKIESGDVAAADQAFNRLCTEYSSAEGFVDQILRICNIFMKENDYAMALPYINRALQASPGHEKAILLLKTKADCYVDMGAADQVDTVVNEIVQNYPTNEKLPSILNMIADRCREQRHYDKSVELYQRSLTKATSDIDKCCAYAGIAKAKARTQGAADVLEVDTILQLLMTDYKDAETLGFHIFQIAEEYYFRAGEAMRNGNPEQARANFQKAIAIWQKNINEIADPQHQSMACYFTAIAYQYVEDYRKSTVYYQKVFSESLNSKHVAHSLFMIGRNYEKHQKAAIAAVVLEDVTDPNSVTASVATSINPVNSTRGAYELLVEEYPDSPGAGYARKWLSKRNSR
jgi:tetratricopeptide (TPR) repeat protein